jgi:glycosyltransferase involved in cell wall biosynthesis
MPSLSEGSPYALLEALAAGLPSVVTSAGGIPEMVSHRVTALMTPPRSPVAIAAAIDQLLADHELAETIAANGRRHVASRFCPALRAEQLLEVYAEVLEERRARAGRRA